MKPKFKVGDIIVNKTTNSGHLYEIVSIEDNKLYTVKGFPEGRIYPPEFLGWLEKNYQLHAPSLLKQEFAEDLEEIINEET